MALNKFRIKIEDQWYDVEIGDLTTSTVEVTVNGESFSIEIDAGHQDRRSYTRRQSSSEQITPQTPLNSVTSHTQVNETILRSPMPGRVMSITVRPGDSVSEGDEVCVVEAMKMEQSIRAPRNGIVKEIHVQPLDSVNANDPLVELE